MTTSEIRKLLSRLDGEAADVIESESLDCKSWDPDSTKLKAQLRNLAEAVICFANAGGGTIVLGVRDARDSRREAIHGVGDLDPTILRTSIYNGTVPPILVDIEELREPEGRLLLVRIPPGVPPHTTTAGLAKIRVGKDCLPLTGAQISRMIIAGGARDLSAEIQEGATIADLDPVQISAFQKLIATAGGKPEVDGMDTGELLGNFGLVHEGGVTLAAILLLGRSSALARWAGQHEVIFLRYAKPIKVDVRHDLRGPLLAVLETLRQLHEAHIHVASIPVGGFGELTVPDLTWWVLREGILNGIVHRDYFQRQSVYVELRPDRVEITSPGGFPGTVTATNVLRHAPVRRNPLLADVLQAAGFVNRAGMGVDRIYEDLLCLGKGMPCYESDDSQVRLIIPTTTHESFARFVATESREGRPLDLDDLILLRGMADLGQLDRRVAARLLQTEREEEAAGLLATLRKRGFLLPSGRGRTTVYRFSRPYSDELRSRLAINDALALDDEAMSLRVQAALAERGTLTNAELRELTGFSRSGVIRLMRGMVVEGLAVLEGRGRGARYVPGPRLPKHPKQLQRRKK